MKVGQKLFVGDDFIVRRTPEEWERGTINPLYEVTVAPRSSHLQQPFVHRDADIQLHSRIGRFSVEVEGKLFTLAENEFLYIPAGLHYSFYSLEWSPALLQIQANSSVVEKDWQ